MTTKLADQPAFPNVGDGKKYDGMTLLQHYAGLETLSDLDHPKVNMQKLIVEKLAGPMPTNSSPEEVLLWEARWRAVLKVIRAKALIAELEKEQK